MRSARAPRRWRVEPFVAASVVEVSELMLPDRVLSEPMLPERLRVVPDVESEFDMPELPPEVEFDIPPVLPEFGFDIVEEPLVPLPVVPDVVPVPIDPDVPVPVEPDEPLVPIEPVESVAPVVLPAPVRLVPVLPDCVFAVPPEEFVAPGLVMPGVPVAPVAGPGVAGLGDPVLLVWATARPAPTASAAAAAIVKSFCLELVFMIRVPVGWR